MLPSDNASSATPLPQSAELPLGMLCSFLFFLARRPVSRSNTHYLASRLGGLKSLLPVLLAHDLPPELRRALGELERTTPASFALRARSLQMRLLAVSRGQIDLPGGFVVTDRRPRGGIAEGITAATIIFGPSVGIGDEIIAFPIPLALKRAGIPFVRAMTTYPRIWGRVRGVDEVKGYADHCQLLEAIRESRPSSELVALLDFEKPGLANLVASEPGAGPYLEISIGAQSAVLVERAHRILRAFRMPTERLINYYDGVDAILRWLGLSPEPQNRFSGRVVARNGDKVDGNFRVFVSPFTSKYDPSPAFWVRLLGDSFSGRQDVPAQIRIDAGANRDTARFAEILKRALSLRMAAGVDVDVARGRDGLSTLPLDDLMTELDSAHVVFCTDSCVAHAAPLFGATAFVLAGPNLENWRVPAAGNYYLDAEDPIERLVSGIRVAMSRVPGSGLPEVRPPMALARAGKALALATDVLQEHLCSNRTIKSTDYERFLSAYEFAIDGLSTWPADFDGLLTDIDYRPRLRPDPAALSAEEFSDHVRSEVARWNNSNLRKFFCQGSPSEAWQPPAGAP